jgi:hypothetical protein
MIIKREGKAFVVYDGRKELFKAASFDQARWFMEVSGEELEAIDNVGHVDLFGECDNTGIDLIRKENCFRNRSNSYKIKRTFTEKKREVTKQKRLARRSNTSKFVKNRRD